MLTEPLAQVWLRAAKGLIRIGWFKEIAVAFLIVLREPVRGEANTHGQQHAQPITMPTLPSLLEATACLWLRSNCAQLRHNVY